jgi:hypothetical protein
MPIDELLRAGLPAALDDVRPDVETDLAVVLRRAGRRTRLRRTAFTAGLVAAVAVSAMALGRDADDPRGSVDPVAPVDEVRVLDANLGTPDSPVPLAAGRYAIPVLGATADRLWGELEVPAGWAQDRLHLATGPDLDPHLRRIELLTVSAVPTDPCNGSMVPVKGGVGATVKALTKQDTVRPSEPRPVWIDGYAGRLVRFQVPVGFDTEECWDGEHLRPFRVGRLGWTAVFPGWTYWLWVVDVEGEPVTVLAAHGPATTPAERAELTGMVEGLDFVAPR